MSAVVVYLLNNASVAEIAEHLRVCNTDFASSLSGRVDINDYAQRILGKATRFEAWSNGTLIGLVATYCNDQEKHIAYITSASVLKDWTGKGIATSLMSRCIKYVEALGMNQIRLEVASDNMPAIKLYEKSGFIMNDTSTPFITMNLYLKNGKEYEQQS